MQSAGKINSISYGSTTDFRVSRTRRGFRRSGGRVDDDDAIAREFTP